MLPGKVEAKMVLKGASLELRFRVCSIQLRKSEFLTSYWEKCNS